MNKISNSHKKLFNNKMFKIKVMKSLFSKLAMLALVSTMFTFGKCGEDEPDPIPVPTEAVLEGEITTSRTLVAATKYTLKGFVYVASGVTLTIEPGTIIKGDKATKGTLIVRPGAKIIADGTAAKPIVFTSAQPKGARSAGDWGGIIVLGKATVNKNPVTIEGENQTTFGGTDDADNSGILRYVRIEFAGIAFETDKEINALTLGGVGSGTTIDYVQVSYSGDDAFEWFGGKVNAKHLVSYRTLDDDFDTDFGYSGNVQYAISLRDPNVADQCSCSSSNIFESDNDGTGTYAKPKTTARFANVSAVIAAGTVNAKYNAGALVRRNSGISIYNSYIIGAFPKAGIELNGSASQANFVSDTSDYRGLYLTGMTKTWLTLDSAKFFTNRLNVVGTPIADLKLDANYNNLTAPKFMPQSSSPFLMSTNAYSLTALGFEAAPFIGAIGTTDWTATWTNFDPQNTDY